MADARAGWAEDDAAALLAQNVRLVPVGLLIDGDEFIPEDIYQAHLPMVVPPGVKCQRVFVMEADEHG